MTAKCLKIYHNHWRAVQFGVAVLALATASYGGGARRGLPKEKGQQQDSGVTIDRDASIRPFSVADSIEMTHFVSPPEYTTDAQPEFSPDGKNFLVVTERGHLESNVREYKLLAFKTEPSSAPVELATFRSSSNRDGIVQPKWLNTEAISFIGENPGEVPQIYLLNWRTHDLKKLSHSFLGVQSYGISQNGSTVVYSANWAEDNRDGQLRERYGFAVTDETLFDLVGGTWKSPSAVLQLSIINTVTNQEHKLAGLPFAGPPPAISVSPDGRYSVIPEPPNNPPALWQSYEDRSLQSNLREQQGHAYKVRPYGISQAMLLDTEKQTITPLLDAPSSSHGRSIVWLPDSSSVLIADTFLPLNIDNPVELARRKASPVVAEVTVPSGSYSRIVDIPRDERWILKDASSTGVLVDAWKLEDGDIRRKLPTRRFERRGNEWALEHKQREFQARSSVFEVTQALDHWPKLVRVDSDQHTETVIFDPNPQLGYFRFGKVEVVRWTGKRGEPLVGGLVYPVGYRAGARVPLVIQTHGFSPDVFLLDGPYTTAFAAQELANKGIAVLQIGESPLYEQAQGTADFGPVNLSQLESAVDHLDGLGLIDRERVALVGFSITGFQVRYALVNSRYHFAAATSAEGNDFGYFSYVAVANQPAWAAQCERPFGGPPWTGNWKPWMEESISFNYDKVHTPLRLESDQNDRAEVIFEWENFIALQRLHKPVELIYVPHGAHPVVKPWDRMTSQEGNVDWLLFWLKGEEDPDPAKIEQYERWHALRELQKTTSEHSTARPALQVH
jgi:dipeptidyl aminopeptidase/acylaminoacyl peptidase